MLAAGAVACTILLALFLVYEWIMFFRNRKQPDARALGKGISILIPFRGDGNEQSLRQRTLDWLLAYYKDALPKAQIVIGTTNQVPFNKCAAFNDAAMSATGDIYVCMDADCYIEADVLLEAAYRLRRDRAAGKQRWTIPYNRFYRLTQACSAQILDSDPADPIVLPDVPLAWQIEEIAEKASSWGHQFGALVQVMPQEAFWFVGGFDERHKSWGSDDVDMMKALDTLWGPHHIMKNPVFHLWHPHQGTKSDERHWIGGEPGANNWLATLYTQAYGNKAKMTALVEQGLAERESDQ